MIDRKRLVLNKGSGSLKKINLYYRFDSGNLHTFQFFRLSAYHGNGSYIKQELCFTLTHVHINQVSSRFVTLQFSVTQGNSVCQFQALARPSGSKCVPSPVKQKRDRNFRHTNTDKKHDRYPVYHLRRRTPSQSK